MDKKSWTRNMNDLEIHVIEADENNGGGNKYGYPINITKLSYKKESEYSRFLREMKGWKS